MQGKKKRIDVCKLGGGVDFISMHTETLKDDMIGLILLIF